MKVKLIAGCLLVIAILQGCGEAQVLSPETRTSSVSRPASSLEVDVFRDNIAPSALTPDQPTTNRDSLFSNPGFEQGTQGWVSCLAGQTSLSDDAFQGSSALEISGGGCVYRTITATPGDTYSLSCQVKLTDTRAWTGMGLEFADQAYQSLGSTPTALASSGQYTQVRTSGVAPQGTSSVSMWVYTDNGAVIDNCLLAQNPDAVTAPAPTTANLLQNPDFSDMDAFAGAEFWATGCTGTASTNGSVLTLDSGACVDQAFSQTTMDTIGAAGAQFSCQVTDAVGYSHMAVFLDDMQYAVMPVTPADVGSQVDIMIEPNSVSNGYVSLFAEGRLAVDNCSLIATAPAPDDGSDDQTAPTWSNGLITVSELTSNSLRVSWSGDSDNVEVVRYEVQVSSGTNTDTINTRARSLPVTGLTPETRYTITVQAIDAAGNVSTNGPTVTATTSPVPVTPDPEPNPNPDEPVQDTSAPVWNNGSIRIGEITPTSIALSWTGASDNVGVVSYVVNYNGETRTISGTSATLTGLSENTAYSISVQAADAAGNLSASGPSTSATTALSADTVAPGWNNGRITLDDRSPTTLTLSWSGDEDNVAVETFVVSYNGGSVNTGERTVTLTGLAPGTEYTVTVQAIDPSGNASVNGPTAVFSTAPDVNTPAVDTQAPQWTDRTIVIGNTTQSTLGISWTAASDNVGVVNYIIRYGIGEVVTSQTSATLRGLAAGTTYTISIQASDAAGNITTDGPTTTGTTNSPPDSQAPAWTNGNVTVAGATPDSLSLSWSGATDNVGVVGYFVSYNGTTVPVSGTSTTLSGLSANTAYAITVQAIDAAGNVSSNGPTTTASTSQAADTTAPLWSNPNLTVGAATSTSLQINWSGASDNVGVASYIVSYNGSQLTVANTSTTLTGLAPGTSYVISVQASDAAGNVSTDGPTATASTAQAADTAAPQWTNGSVTVTNATTTSLQLSWTGASDNVGIASYRVIYNGSQITVADTSTTLTGLIPDTVYAITVQAIDTAGNVSVNGPSTTGATTQAPDNNPPSWTDGVVRVDNATQDSLSISWAGATDDVAVDSYVVEYNNATAVVSATATTLVGLSPGTSYLITVQAVDAAGNTSTDGPTTTGATTQALDDVPPVWTNGTISVDGANENSLRLSWSGATDNVGVLSYRVSYNDAIADVTDTAITLAGLSAGTSYTITVQALDAAGNLSTNGPTTTASTTSVVVDDPPVTGPDIPPPVITPPPAPGNL